MNNELDTKVIKLRNEIAEKQTRFKADAQKLFLFCVMYAQEQGTFNENNEIVIPKKELLNYLGYKSNDKYKLLRDLFQRLIQASYIKFGNVTDFKDGMLFVGVDASTDKNLIKIEVKKDYAPLFLEYAKDFPYTRLLAGDIAQFDSKYTMMLYQNLMRLKHKSIEGVNFTTEQLKYFFGLDPNAYYHEVKNKKGEIRKSFNRSAFEKYVIDVAVKEINNKAKCISNLTFEKEFDKRIVKHYTFKFDYNDPKNFANTEPINADIREVKEPAYTEAELEARRKAGAEMRKQLIEKMKKDNV